MRQRVEKYWIKRSRNSRDKASKYQYYPGIFWHFNVASDDTL